MGVQRYTLKNREVLVYVSVGMYCIAYFMSRVKVPISQRLIYWTMIIAAFIAVGNVFLDTQLSSKQIIISLIVGALILLGSIPVRNFEILYLYCLVWSCRNLENDEIIRYITKIMLCMIVITWMLSVVGVVEGSIQITNEIRERYDFGYSSWAILPLQYTMMFLFLLYLKREKIHVRDVILGGTIGIAICIKADVKTGIIILFAGTIGLILCDCIAIKKWKKLYFLVALPEILTLGSYLSVKLYAHGKYNILSKINSVLNNRLMYPAQGLDKYGIHILSNPQYETIYNDAGYFGIDNSYLYILVSWGIIIGTVILVAYSYIIYNCIKKQNLRLLFLTILLVCSAVLWNRLLVLIEYQIVICFSDVFKIEGSRNKV